MKNKILILSLACVASLHGQVLLTDTFSGPALDTSKWTTILPASSSSVVQANGVLTTTGRGILATTDLFPTPYIISGSFAMQSSLEHFNIVSRTDLSSGSFYERPGILISFSNDGDQISIQRYTSATGWSLLAEESYPLVTGQRYDFSITDTGNLVTLAVNGFDQLFASSTYATGEHIAFYSREFPDTSTEISSITISAIPEPSAYAGILGTVALAFAAARRRLSIVET